MVKVKVKVGGDGMTQKEIAKELNVSIMTVSKALRGHSDISGEMTRRVLEEAEKHSYVPNLLARDLLKQKSDVIGFIFPDITFDYAQNIMDGAKSVLKDYGYRTLIGLTSWSIEEEESEVDIMLQRKMDGIVCQPISDHSEHFRKVIANNRPLVFVGNCLGDCPGASWIGLDGEDATNQMMGHLFDLGHRRIAFVAPDNIETSRSMQPRLEAYKSFHSAHGMSLDESLICLANLGETSNIYQILEPMMKSKTPPTAILCASDVIAYEVMHTLMNMGLKIPSDVSVAGMYGLSMSAYEMISLTTIELDAKIIGEMAADVIIRQLKNGKCSQNVKLLKGELVQRKSTGSPK